MGYYPVKRGLDDIFFRVERDGKWQNVCFTDMTVDEQKEVMKGRNEVWLSSLALRLAEVVRDIGDSFDIATHLADEDE